MSRTNKLPSASLPLSANDKFEVSQNGAPKQVAFSEMGGAPVWGSIGGTITDQTDLTSYITGLGYITATSANTLTNKTWNGNVIAAIYGGTGWGSYTAGDMLYAYDASTLAKLPKGTDGEVLTMVSGVPAWAAAGGGGWGLTGNAGTTEATDFIGTTDAKGFTIKVNNVQSMFIASNNIRNIGNAVVSIPVWASAFGIKTIFQDSVLMKASDATTKSFIIGVNPESYIIKARSDGAYEVDVLKITPGSPPRITMGLGISLSGISTSTSFISAAGLESSNAPGVGSGVPGGCLALASTSSSFTNYTANGAYFGWAIGMPSSVGDFIYYRNPSSRNVFNGTEVLRLIRNTGNVCIGTSTDVASSLFTLASTNKGFLPPRMTTTQRTDIATPAEGLIVYDTTIKKLYLFTTAWEQITSV